MFDDIASLMDDVSMGAKVATQKTAGILGDDLAVNAEKATGFLSSRELPVLWTITKGSLLNKLIIVPIALALNAFLPIGIKVLLVLGGFYLAYEGVEKIIEYFFHAPKKGEQVMAQRQEPNAPSEKDKIKSAIATDFVLSVEIVIMALGEVLTYTLMGQVMIVSIVAVLATIGVYGLVALIVRMDDAGYKLIKRADGNTFVTKLGRLLVKALPVVIKIIGYIGTAALILVSGGIFVHNIGYLHHLLPQVPAMIKEIAIGLLAGMVMVGLMTGAKKVMALFERR